MNHADRLKTFNETLLLLTTLRRMGTLTRLADEIAGTRNGHKSGHLGGGSFSEDVEAAADGEGPTGQHDRTSSSSFAKDAAALDLDSLDHMLTDMLGKARAMDDLRRRYLVPAVVASKAMQRKSDEGCEVVARVGSWEPVAHFTDDQGCITVNGVKVSVIEPGSKPRRIGLGSWAHGFARQVGRRPHDHETEAHIQGKRVRPRAS